MTGAEAVAAGITPSRITMALDAGDHYGPEVDVACGGAEPMVDEWEAGLRQPTAEQVELLAELTGFAVVWFTQPDLLPVVGWACQRSGKGKGCHRIDTRVATPAQGTLL